MRILVVDDDPDLCLLMKLFLSRQGGHDVSTAGDGLAALEVLAAAPPDLVVMDWSMPRLDGLGLCRRIREQPAWSAMPLLMVTALPDHATALAAGIDRVLTKPFTSATLLAAVEDLGGRAPAA